MHGSACVSFRYSLSFGERYRGDFHDSDQFCSPHRMEFSQRINALLLEGNKFPVLLLREKDWVLGQSDFTAFRKVRCIGGDWLIGPKNPGGIAKGELLCELSSQVHSI